MLDISAKTLLSKQKIEECLAFAGEQHQALLNLAYRTKLETIGNTVYFRGLIEFSNICSKNCYYCGIRSGNTFVKRYELSEHEILQVAHFAYKHQYGSVVLQGGERTGEKYTEQINNLIRKIKQLSNNELGITLSLGEQTPEVYRRWFDSGAHRYLLRIETSNPELYSKIHPKNKQHSFDKRIKCLHSLKTIGYQTGTGIMAGLPYQTISDLADDIQFMTQFNVDMVGMGPFIEHAKTPFYKTSTPMLSLQERFNLTLKMLAIIRIMVPDINMVASTAMQAIDPMGREKALLAGANIIMPNTTPNTYRENYKLYENKPGATQNADDTLDILTQQIETINHQVGWNLWGDSEHYKNRLK